MVIFREELQLLSLIIFWFVRLFFFGVDSMASVSFAGCADVCDISDDKRIRCNAFLVSVMWFNGLALLAFGLIFGIRWRVEERNYYDAVRVSYMLLGFELLLKLNVRHRRVYTSSASAPQSSRTDRFAKRWAALAGRTS